MNNLMRKVELQDIQDGKHPVINIVRIKYLDNHPKFRLPDDLPVSDKFRKEFDQWLLEFFGYRKYGPYLIDNTLYCDTEDFNKIMY